MFVKLLLLFVFIQKTLTVSLLANKIKADIETGYLCPDNNQLEVPMRLFRFDRINHTHRALSTEFTIAHPIEGTSLAEKFIDGGWKTIPSLPFFKDPCKNLAMRYAKETVIEIGKAMGLAHPERCPFPAGNYSLHRWPFQILSDAAFWTGRFRFQTVLRKTATKTKMFCAFTVVNFVEIVE